MMNLSESHTHCLDGSFMFKALPSAFVALSLAAFAPLPLSAGSLTIFASGEDLATRGFNAPKLTRDGWALEFARIMATFDQITAWQTDPPFLADGPEIVGRALAFDGPVTVDLVDADDDHRVALARLDAPEGHFNALSWALVPASDGVSLLLEGVARKDGREVPFLLRSSDRVMHACGEYLGDERKGFVISGGEADLEITLHLDHLFGRADKAADDPMNLEALGFDRFAETPVAEFTLAGLHLGHAGEAHCHVQALP